MTEDLTTALRTMAESDWPPVMDVERVLQEGRHSLLRRRMAALGGGTAVLAATALAVGVLAPAGSAGHRGTTTGAASPTTAAPQAMRTLPADVSPHDPIVSYYQFGYLPQGMSGAGNATGGNGFAAAFDASGYQLALLDAPPPHNGPSGKPPVKFPAKVPGAVQAYWEGDEKGRLVGTFNEGGTLRTTIGKNGDVTGVPWSTPPTATYQFAVLHWQLPGGQWLQLTVSNVQDRSDWKELALKVAAGVVKQERSVPMPLQVTTALPAGLTFQSGDATRLQGNTYAELWFLAGPDEHSSPEVGVIAFKTGSQDMATLFPHMQYTCADSNGLTVCVEGDARAMTAPPMAAIGGAKGLLQRIKSLGTDSTGWTTNVFP